LTSLARDLGESTLLGRAGGAPTLAVGMAQVFSSVIGGKHLMALWYHFAIMFEALFILTTVDAGTRVGRFLVQAGLKHISPALGKTHSFTSNLLASVLLVGGWGYFLYQGVIDPLGGINSLWPLFGIANQLLAVIALCLGTTVLIKMGRFRGCIATLLPLGWVATVTFTAAVQKIGSSDPKIGFLAASRALGAQLEKGALSEAARTVIQRTQFNLRVDAVVASVFLILVSAIVLFSIGHWVSMLVGRKPRTLVETPIVRLSNDQLLEAPRHAFKRSVQGMGLFVLGLLRQLAGEPVENRHPDDPLEARCDARAGSDTGKGNAWVARVERRSNQPRCC